jgi:hypothetical protein
MAGDPGAVHFFRASLQETFSASSAPPDNLPTIPAGSPDPPGFPIRQTCLPAPCYYTIFTNP